ncbi:MAG: iron ABC transporter permease [Chloroflexi bacterium]|nr:iron ABC transporter permease [Chloroflexota bacterium]
MVSSLAAAWTRKGISRSSVWATGLLLLVGFLALSPALMVVYASLNSGSPMRPGTFTLDGYWTVFSTPRAVDAMWTSLWLAVTRTATSVGIAAFFAWVVARTDTPWRSFLHFALAVRMFIPSLPLIAAWMLLASPKSGMLNVWLMSLLPFDGPIFDIYSSAGIIVVSTFGAVPIWFLILLPAFTQMDASFEESSRMCGVGSVATFFRVTLPLLAPALFAVILLSLIHWLETFDTEIFLGGPAGIYVISTVVYQYIQQSMPAKYPPAMAFSTVLTVLTAALVFIYWARIASKQRKYTVVTGRGYAVRPIRLGRWKYVTLALALLYFFVSTVLPASMVFILGPFMKTAGVFAGNWFTLEHWAIVTVPQVRSALMNSLILAVSAATLGAVLYAVSSYLILRTSFKGRGLLELVTWVPYTMPGIVLALGLLWVYVGTIKLPFIVMYGSMQMLVLACIIKRLPLGVRTMNGVTIQIGKELEEASRVHGASWSFTFTRVLIPLLWPGIVSVWLLTGIFSVQELVVVLMLYGVDTMTLSVYFFVLLGRGMGFSSALVIGMLEFALIVLFWLTAKLLSRRVGASGGL